ncbi:hypothetical protein [Kangiella japonica]|uniref:hypothetical protein n=1 Tax=Kangiella japonica TaxID=647384 RepID=UPI0031D54D53
MKYRYCIWLLIIFTLLYIGGVLYLQGAKDVVVVQWLRAEIPFIYEGLMTIANASPSFYRSGWIAHHLADILWSTSFAMLICGIWVGQLTLLKLLPLGITCAIFYEVLQLVGVAGGTFDEWDLFYSFCAGGVATVFSHWLLRRKPSKNAQ